MPKRILSAFLSFIFVCLAVVWPNSPLEQTVSAAFAGETVTKTLSDGSSYTYVEEPGFKEYNPNDPNAMVLFSSSTIKDWVPKASDSDGVENDYWSFGTNHVSAGAIGTGTGGDINFTAQGNNNYANLKYFVRYKSGDPYTNGSVATDDQLLVLNTWGVTRMLGVQMVDPTPGDGSFPGVGSDNYDYYYNFQVYFNRSVDLTKFTHLYFDFWVSSDYTIRTPGQINLALVNRNVSYNDGFEYNIDMSKLKLDGDNPRTGHTYRMDLRSYSTTTVNGKTISMSDINGFSIRYMTPTSDKTQYNSGKTPLIWFGRLIAYTEVDNFHPATHWYNGSNVEYTSSTMPEKNQSDLFVFTGAQNWNASTTVFVPMWFGGKGSRIMQLEWGGRTTSDVDYYVNALDLGMWRWRRRDITSAGYTGTVTDFPAKPLFGGGGSLALSVKRHGSQYLSDTTHGSFVVS